MFDRRLCRLLSSFLAGALCCGSVSATSPSADMTSNNSSCAYEGGREDGEVMDSGDEQMVEPAGDGDKVSLKWKIAKGVATVATVSVVGGLIYKYRAELYRWAKDIRSSEDFWEFICWAVGGTIAHKLDFLLSLYVAIYDLNLDKDDILNFIGFFIPGDCMPVYLALRESGTAAGILDYLKDKFAHSGFVKDAMSRGIEINIGNMAKGTFKFFSYVFNVASGYVAGFAEDAKERLLSMLP